MKKMKERKKNDFFALKKPTTKKKQQQRRAHSFSLLLCFLVEHPQDLVVPVQQQLFTFVLQGGASVFREQNGVSLFDRDGDDLPREGGAASWPHGDDLALGELWDRWLV
jgi:hypothetical protein